MITSLELRKAIRQKFAWPGGYEIFGITADGAALCCDCMRSEYQQIASARRTSDRMSGWHVDAIMAACETDSETVCDHCGKIIVEGCEND